ncbi:GMF family protein, partial [Ascobolus immersus RN42]
MASEARLYTFSSETLAHLRKFRLGTSRSATPKAEVYSINQKTLEIALVDDEVYEDLESLAEDLPETTPRFILLSYPLTLDDGRKAQPYVLVAWLPNTKPENAMLYAAAKELFR